MASGAGFDREYIKYKKLQVILCIMILSKVCRTNDVTSKAGVIPGLMLVTDRCGATPHTSNLLNKLIRTHNGADGSPFCVGGNYGPRLCKTIL